MDEMAKTLVGAFVFWWAAVNAVIVAITFVRGASYGGD